MLMLASEPVVVLKPLLSTLPALLVLAQGSSALCESCLSVFVLRIPTFHNQPINLHIWVMRPAPLWAA